MRACGFSARYAFLIIQLGAWSVASSQSTPPFGENPSFLGDEFAETEQLPRFQVEILAFAYNAFDPTEEQFHRKPRRAPPVEAAEPPVEPGPSGAIEPFRQPLVWGSGGVESNQPPVPGTPPADGDTGGEFVTDATRETSVEEELSVSEQILSTLLSLEEEPDALGTADATGPPAENADPFADDSAADAPDESLDLARPGLVEDEPAEEPFQFRFLEPEELELTAAFERLTNLDAYTVLVHGGWVQEGLPEDRAHPFSLSLLGALNPVGTVQLHLSRFLHVTVELDYYARPQGPASPRYDIYSDVLEELSLPPKFELRTTRRTRSGELHYFDHPAFGLLVIVRPEPEAPEDPEEPAEPLDPPLGPAA